eukprot:g41167.t1
MLLQFAGGVIVTLEDAQDGHVTQGVGGGVKMVHDRKVLSFVANGALMLYKTVSESRLGLTDIEEATSGAADTVDHVGGCAGEQPQLLQANLIIQIYHPLHPHVDPHNLPKVKPGYCPVSLVYGHLCMLQYLRS